MLEEKEQKKMAKKTASGGKRQENKKSNRNGESQGQSSKSKRQCRKTITESKVECATKAVACVCGIKENSAEDRKLNVDWIKCYKCGKWLHETCAQLNGVFDDEYFYCDSCVD